MAVVVLVLAEVAVAEVAVVVAPALAQVVVALRRQ